MKKENKKVEEALPAKSKRLIEEPFPQDVREAIEAMQRTAASRINRPIFRIPALKYTRVA